MKRFFVSAAADRDLDEIMAYWDELPSRPAGRVSDRLQRTIYKIAAEPYLGAAHSLLTRLIGEEVRSRAMPPYRLFYRFVGEVPEIVAILHTARDIPAILKDRFQ